MARIAGIDLPKDKRIEIGLTYIYGIGRTSANKILAAAGINPDTRVKDLTDEDEAKLREIIARGVDRAVLVSGREFGGSDTYATSQILAAAINKIGLDEDDIVFCGRQAIDGDTAQVGPQIAEKLHLPQVTYAADIQKDGNSLTVKRMLEDGYMMVKVQTPCLLTCIKELNQPRYMSINGIFTCYDKPMEVYDYNALKDDPLIEVDTIGLKGSPTNVFKSFTPPQKGAGTMLTGDDVAAQLAGVLAKKHLI